MIQPSKPHRPASGLAGCTRAKSWSWLAKVKRIRKGAHFRVQARSRCGHGTSPDVVTGKSIAGEGVSYRVAIQRRQLRYFMAWPFSSWPIVSEPGDVRSQSAAQDSNGPAWPGRLATEVSPLEDLSFPCSRFRHMIAALCKPRKTDSRACLSGL